VLVEAFEAELVVLQQWTEFHRRSLGYFALMLIRMSRLPTAGHRPCAEFAFRAMDREGAIHMRNLIMPARFANRRVASARGAATAARADAAGWRAAAPPPALRDRVACVTTRACDAWQDDGEARRPPRDAAGRERP
jgi:hypothetical protein